MVNKPARRPLAQAPSRTLRRIAKFSLPIAIIFGLLAAGALISLVHVLASIDMDHALPSALAVVIKIGQVALFGTIAYGVGVELPRAIRGWDDALDEREAVTGGDVVETR